ncbi:antitoxin of toxin-antitoxin stability system [Actinobacillus pleuropneumoniae]|nr:antitoxin of toxin-antitoxin stability system [Actinobacillus pleuropneumoniae]
MKIITSREFNQNLGKAQKAALTAPVIITNPRRTRRLC